MGAQGIVSLFSPSLASLLSRLGLAFLRIAGCIFFVRRERGVLTLGSGWGICVCAGRMHNGCEVHAWVGGSGSDPQVVNEKRPSHWERCTRALGAAPALSRRPWLHLASCLKAWRGILGACFKTLLQLSACAPRPEKWHRAE